MNTARGYCTATRRMEEFEVTSKIRTDVRGHFTYMLRGTGPRGITLHALVNKTQWDRYDVPVVEKAVTRTAKQNRELRDDAAMRYLKKPLPKQKSKVKKCRKRVFNEDIERWIAEHNDLDFDKLDGMDDGIIRPEEEE